MSYILIINCSPRANGVSDNLAYQFCRGAASIGVVTKIIALRSWRLQACTGCGFCKHAPYNCVFDPDPVTDLFNLFFNSSLVVFSSPIYFYALPANFKAFIDRGQKFWSKLTYGNVGSKKEVSIPVIAIFSAGRKKGDLLFDGALRSLRWFLKCLHANLIETCLTRGIEEPEMLTGMKKLELFNLGIKWGHFVQKEKL